MLINKPLTIALNKLQNPLPWPVGSYMTGPYFLPVLFPSLLICYAFALLTSCLFLETLKPLLSLWFNIAHNSFI